MSLYRTDESPLPATPTAARQTERPLLARVAENIFWTARYVERAEHLARGTLVTTQLASDAGDLDDRLRDQLWHGLLEAFDLVEPAVELGETLGDAVVRYVLTDADNPTSACTCVARARENARAVRGEISLEMWQTLNEFYWSLEGGGRNEGAGLILAESAETLLQHLVRSSMHFQGVTDQTLAHNRRWDFALTGRLLERADASCRLLLARVELLAKAGESLETPLRNIQLMAALRMCGSIEAYRRQHANNLSIEQVVGFLLLRADHPRSIRFAIASARRAVARIHGESGPGLGHLDEAERLLGRMATRLEYADLSEVAHDGGRETLTDVRRCVAQANAALQQRYFAG
ncbi:MAG: alpha-E domain-containing protein [Planctomycetota bacterium]